jgi:hypothetical protein
MVEVRWQMADGTRKASLFPTLFNCVQINNYLRQVVLTLAAILLMLLTACGNIGLLPSDKLVQKAIALQLEQTQQQLRQKLDLDFQGFDIKRLKVTEEKPLTIESLPSFRVRGKYDLIMKLPTRQLTLLPERVGKNTEPIWHSYLIL